MKWKAQREREREVWNVIVKERKERQKKYHLGQTGGSERKRQTGDRVSDGVFSTVREERTKQ